MKNSLLFFVAALLLLGTTQCKDILPTIKDVSTSNITSASADMTFTITDATEGEPTIEYGVFYGVKEWQSENLHEYALTLSGGAGTYSITIEGLNDSTTYYLTPYARNSKGYAYGLKQTITTSVKPEGSINALFSVAADKKVFFSQGNLQCRVVDKAADSYEWRFADDQWYWLNLGKDYATLPDDYTGWISHFGWGTSGYNHGAVCYSPKSTSENNADYYAYGNAASNLYDGDGKADWGYNKITNGGNVENSGWRTMNLQEAMYLLYERDDAESKKAFAQIRTGYENGNFTYTRGLLLLPDHFVLPANCPFEPTSDSTSFAQNSYDPLQWKAMEAQGAIFLPMTGIRIGTTIENINGSDFECGGYWLSSAASINAKKIGFVHNVTHNFFILTNSKSICSSRIVGQSVRLVRDKK